MSQFNRKLNSIPHYAIEVPFCTTSELLPFFLEIPCLQKHQPRTGEKFQLLMGEISLILLLLLLLLHHRHLNRKNTNLCTSWRVVLNRFLFGDSSTKPTSQEEPFRRIQGLYWMKSQVRFCSRTNRQQWYVRSYSLTLIWVEKTLRWRPMALLGGWPKWERRSGKLSYVSCKLIINGTT